MLALVGFLAYESRRHDPFIDLRFFGCIPFVSAAMIAVCAFAAWGAFPSMMSLYLQDERGFSPINTGLIYLPVAIGALVFSPLPGRMVGRYGSRPSLVIAGVLITASTVLLTALSATTPVWQLFVIFAVRRRLLDGQRADHHTGGEWNADRPGRSRIGGGCEHQPPGRRQSRCGSVRFNRRISARDMGTDYAVAAGPLWLICGDARVDDHCPRRVLDVAARPASPSDSRR